MPIVVISTSNGQITDIKVKEAMMLLSSKHKEAIDVWTPEECQMCVKLIVKR